MRKAKRVAILRKNDNQVGVANWMYKIIRNSDIDLLILKHSFPINQNRFIFPFNQNHFI